MTTRCISSHLMSPLLEWRNPQGSETNWTSREQRVNNVWAHVGKVVTTEIGLAVLATAAVVETIAYSALAVLSLTLSPLTKEPFKFFAKLLASSSFTIIWALADFFYFNPIVINVMTSESGARFWSGLRYRDDDRLYMANALRSAHPRYTPSISAPYTGPGISSQEWAGVRSAPQEVNQLFGMMRPIVQDAETTISSGARFLREDVLAGASQETKDAFRECDTHTYMFILTKAVSIYTIGSKKNEEIPHFFKDDTIDRILALRRELAREESAGFVAQVEQRMANPAAFDAETATAPTAGTPEAKAQALFQRLKNIASEELQHSIFVTQCWQRAAQDLV